MAIIPYYCKHINVLKLYRLTSESGKDFNSIIISGTECRRKTVSLKTVGLLALMVQCGILVPVQYDSKFRIFKEIFVSIGDQQSLENDLSTFSSHIAYLKKILDNSD